MGLMSRLHRGWNYARDWSSGASSLVAAEARRWRHRAAAAGAGECGSVPIVVLPGVFERATFLHSFTSWLANQGHPVHLIDSLGLNIAALDTSIQEVLRELESADLREVVLVAHSKGGLIGKGVLMADADQRVLGMVAVASPFAGSPLGGPFQRLPWVKKSSLGMFVPGSKELGSLSANAEVNSRIVSVIPAWDQAVPADSARLEGATNIDVDAGGHFGVLHDPHVRELVHQQVHSLAQR